MVIEELYRIQSFQFSFATSGGVQGLWFPKQERQDSFHNFWNSVNNFLQFRYWAFLSFLSFFQILIKNGFLVEIPKNSIKILSLPNKNEQIIDTNTILEFRNTETLYHFQNSKEKKESRKLVRPTYSIGMYVVIPGEFVP